MSGGFDSETAKETAEEHSWENHREAVLAQYPGVYEQYVEDTNDE